MLEKSEKFFKRFSDFFIPWDYPFRNVFLASILISNHWTVLDSRTMHNADSFVEHFDIDDSENYSLRYKWRNKNITLCFVFFAHLKLMILDKSLILSNLILSARSCVNCCGNYWRCLDLLNWRLCNNKCVSNTIWLKNHIFIWVFFLKWAKFRTCWGCWAL